MEATTVVTFSTCKEKGSSPTRVAWPVVELYPCPGFPPDPDRTPLTVPSVHGVYKFPSDAHDGYLRIINQ